MPEKLSGGMRKRSAWRARSSAGPAAFFTTSPRRASIRLRHDSINHLIRRLPKRLGVTSVVVTHDMKTAFHTADRIAFLHEGRIHFLGTSGELRASTDPILADFIHGVRASPTSQSRITMQRKGVEFFVGLFLLIGRGDRVDDHQFGGRPGDRGSLHFARALSNASGLVRVSTSCSPAPSGDVSQAPT